MSNLRYFFQISLLFWLRFLAGSAEGIFIFSRGGERKIRSRRASGRGAESPFEGTNGSENVAKKFLDFEFYHRETLILEDPFFSIGHGWLRLGAFLVSFLSGSLVSWNQLPAGVTSSQTVVVVNGQSEDSRTIANHYANWRGIPNRNIIVLREVPPSESVSVDTFRTKILQPLLQEIDRRQLGSHVRCIAYSADFPTAIEIEKDLATLEKRPIFITPVGSINGLTYLYQMVLQPTPQYVSLDANFYSRRPATHYFTNPFPTNKAKRWEEIRAMVEEGKHLEAAKAYDNILLEMPNQFPAAYLAAQHYALAAEPEQAFDLLTAAVDAGWCFDEEAEANQAFETMKTLPQWKRIFESVPKTSFEHQPSVGFEAKSFWGPNGISSSIPEEGIRYMLSTVLAVTRGQGNSVEEALRALRRSVHADFTRPAGTFYFTSTADIRTKTRQPAFDLAIRALKRAGYPAEVVAAPLPQSKRDCLGVMLGTPDFDWESSGAKLVEGAIAENLTSLGGIMTPGPGQTKLSALIRAGAAASSGTVTEPYAIQAKFPHPMLYAHYAEGATLAEAFYMSVTGPYQLLIVGDPLCQPFCRPPSFEIEGLVAEQSAPRMLKLKIKPQVASADAVNAASKGNNETQLDSNENKAKSKEKSTTPNVTAADSPTLQKMQILIDGRLAQESLFAENLAIDLSQLDAGYHEMSLIATDDSLLQREWELKIPFYYGIERDEVSVQSTDVVQRDGDEFWEVQLKANRADALEVQVWGETLGKVEGKEGTVKIQKKGLGTGPICLQPVAIEGSNRILGTPKIVIIQ